MKKKGKISAKKTMWLLLVIMFLIITISLYGDSCNWFTYTNSSKIHTCNYHHINVWQQVSFTRTIMTMFSFIIALVFGMVNLSTMRANDYERTKAKLVIRFRKHQGSTCIELVNLGETKAKLIDVLWDTDLTLNDVTPREKIIKHNNKNIFSEKIGKYIYPMEEITYDIMSDYPIYEKIAVKHEFNVQILWEDYKEKQHTFEYHFDFTGDFSIIDIAKEELE